VFSPPSRQASRAENIGQARAWNVNEVGRSLSAQAWGICKKIVEVDRVLLGDPSATRTVFEVHPEVCFWALNGGKPMRHRKSKPEGVRERLATLSIWQPEANVLLQRVLRETRRRDVQADDVLDALVAHVTGRAVAAGLRRLIGVPSEDDEGLPMQMLFRDHQLTLLPPGG
jgi:predicted RNase H-like nuclease